MARGIFFSHDDKSVEKSSTVLHPSGSAVLTNHDQDRQYSRRSTIYNRIYTTKSEGRDALGSTCPFFVESEEREIGNDRNYPRQRRGAQEWVMDTQG